MAGDKTSSGSSCGAVGESARPFGFARLLAAADMFHTKCERRPHRVSMPAEQAAQALAAEAKAGRLDPGAVAAVVESAGQRVPRLDRPNGLTDREGQVLALRARTWPTRLTDARL